jgi:GNAT superfamily N-acetyltransferase
MLDTMITTTTTTTTAATPRGQTSVRSSNLRSRLTVEVRDLDASELPAAAAVLARSMRDNPLHLAAIGPDPLHREKAFTGIFGTVLARMHEHGAVLGAFDDDLLVGAAAFTPPSHGELSPREKLALTTSVIRHAGIPALSRVLHWMGEWADREPAEPHWHVGPLAVEFGWQCRGVGGALLRECCRRVDATGEAAYLETDKSVNVFIYERHGFRCVGHAEVLGVSNWFMRRQPGGP